MGTTKIIALSGGPLKKKKGTMAAVASGIKTNNNMENRTTNKIRKRSYNRKKRRQNKERQRLHINTNSKENNKIANNSWHGDRLTLDNKWPNINSTQTLRILGQNLNGISYYNNYLDLDMTLQQMDAMQVCIAGYSEVNLDMNKNKIKYEVTQKIKNFDRSSSISMSSSKTTLTTSKYKRGGTLSITRGTWAGRVIQKGQDSLGRWSYTTLLGKKGKLVKIITTYRVCKKPSGNGDCTIRSQQERDLFETRKKLLDPREEILKDLETMIVNEHKKGTIVILMGDMNEDISKGKRIISFLDNTSMKSIIQQDSEGNMPATHDRGSGCIDLLAISSHCDNEVVLRSGYLPFYYGNPTDHRGYYCDLNAKILFDHASSDQTNSNYRTFSTDNIKKCNKYVHAMEKGITDNKILEKINKIEKEMNQFTQQGKGCINTMIEQCKILFNKTTELMISSERKVGKQHYNKSYPFSPKLKDAATKIIKIRKDIRSESINYPVDQGRLRVTKEQLKEAYKQLRKVQKQSGELRNSHLQELSEKRAGQWSLKTKDAAKIIREAEKSRKMHKAHKWHLKLINKGAINHLFVPYPINEWIPKKEDIQTKECQMRIDQPIDIFNILLRQNFTQLLKSKSSVFTKGKIKEAIGWEAANEISEQILQGIQNENIENATKDNKPLQLFIKSMKKLQTRDGNTIEEMKWNYGIEEYKQTFSKTRESTACGPSGLHMSHWKAALESVKIMRAHSFFIWAAFKYGFAYERWETSIHCMLKKKSNPFAQKLRIIQLFEGDFNGALKHIIGRKLMKHITSTKNIDGDVYGSRTGKTAIEALLNLQLVFDHHRIWKKTMAMIFNDADGCFDRIPTTLAAMALQKIGLPSLTAKAHTVTQMNMKHYIKIAPGVSSGYIKFKEEEHCMYDKNNNIISLRGPIGGVGQGGGASPIIWTAVLLIMLEAYKKVCQGTILYDITKAIKVIYWIISYVDDNTILRSFPSDTTTFEILFIMRNCLHQWHKLLLLTGGDLSLDKCKISILRWKQRGLWGLQSPEKLSENNDTLTIVPEGGTKETLHRLDYNEAERILGIRLPMSGEMTHEFKHRKKQMLTFAAKINNAPFQPHDAHVVYQSRYRAMIQYPLPITTFTTNQLHTIQKPVIFHLLPKLGMNRHMPREVVYGPRPLGGREIMDLRIEQPYLNIKTTLANMRRGEKAGSALLITLRDVQAEIGTSKPFYTLDPNLYGYGDQYTRWRYTWTVNHNMNLNMQVEKMWVPEADFSNDINIMETAVQDNKFQGKNKWRLKLINQCRLYLQIFFVGDMIGPDGKISMTWMNGTTIHKHRKYNLPSTQKPTNATWSIWKEFVFKNFITGNRVVSPILLPQTTTVPSQTTPIHTLTQQLEQLDAKYKQIIGDIHFTQQELHFLIDSIKEGTMICGSDASVVESNGTSKGTHAYSLQDSQHDHGRIFGSSFTPMSTNMCSLTAESYGTIAILIILREVCCNLQTNKTPVVTITNDNKEVMKRCQEKPEIINANQTMVAEYDLWQLMHELIEQIPMNLEFVWQKGHKDELPDGRKIEGPFRRPAQINIEMDREARKKMDTHQNPYSTTHRRPMYSQSIINFYTTQGIMIGDIKQYMLDTRNGPKLQRYITKKYGWNQMDQQQINWKALEEALKKQTTTRQTRLTQLMYNWQNVGTQKEKIESSDSSCPTNCGEIETPCHYLECKNESMLKERHIQQQAFLHKMDKTQTHPGIKISMIRIMNNEWTSNTNLDEQFPSGDERLLKEAIAQQLQLGQQSLEKGFLCKAWDTVQHEWSKSQNNNKKDRFTWASHTITALQTYTMNIWKHRNTFIHGANKKENKEKQIIQCHKRIDELYEGKDKFFTVEQQCIFNKQKHVRKKQGLEAMSLWISMAELLLATKTKGDQSTLDSCMFINPNQTKTNKEHKT